MQARSTDDGALITAIAGGDHGALTSLYQAYAPLLLGLAARILGHGREAEDLLHDVFLEVWRHAGDYDARRGSVRTWLTLRLRSRALDRRRSVRVSRSVPLDEGFAARADPGGDDPELAPDRKAVCRALSQLPEEQRAVIELAYFEGLSSSEVAARLDIPIGTVKSRTAAARAKLRAAVLGRTEA